MKFIKRVRAVGSIGAVAAAESESDAAALADGFDALILSGGMDIDPAIYGQTPNPSNTYDGAERDRSDELLFRAFYSRGKRVMGICRGCQAINVFMGGTLHQHLPDAFEPVLWHARNILGRHGASIAPGTALALLLGAGDIRVNSSHHQAIDRPGEGLAACAIAPDGVTEAAEGRNVLLIQWHPEWMGDEHGALFKWLTGGEA
jgi:putative glutamine amidotransferase